MDLASPAHVAALVASAVGAGAMNAMAGGGTILTFPTLIFLGMPAIAANATSTVALLPGAAASLAGFRDDVLRYKAWLKTLFLPSLLGGIAGSVLLLRTPEKTFAHLAPVLILLATVLFMARGALARRFMPAGEGAGEPDPSRLSRRRWLAATLVPLA